MHKTKRALIDTLVALKNGNPAAEVTLSQVLEASGVASGSLYHHFSDFHELVDYALVEMYGQFAEDIATRLTTIVGGSTNASETEQKLSPAIDARHLPDFSALRAARAWIAAQASLRPELGAKLAEEQHRVTSEIAKIVADAQARGIAQPDLDPYVVAVFIEAYTMGRIVDDLGGKHMDEVAWAQFIKHMVSRAILNFKN